jgi:muconate cycloisomerase
MRMIRAGAVDIFNVTHQSGGMWGAARLFALADAAGLQCLISTTQEMSIGTAAVAHLGATVPVLHYPGDAVGPLLYVDDVVVDPIRFDGTQLVIPDGPGLGVALDPGRLEALRGSLVEWNRPAHGVAYLNA